MSDAAHPEMDMRAALARIDRALAETAKLLAEQEKLRAEHRKLLAEAAKMNRERAFMPFQVMISGLAAGGALVGGTVALVKWLGG